MSKKNRPFLRPPVQRVTLMYYIAREIVKQGCKRFHRYSTIKGLEKLPKEQDPFILVSNHQNGMMDPLLITSLIKTPLHWLTRADVFWNPFFRKLLFKFNQIPIYRKRDRLLDLRKRNEAIWNCCIERLKIGTVLSIFPEGNHKPQKNIRNLKRGLSDILNLAVSKDKRLLKLKIIPLGLDYEDYPGYRRRFCLRIGDPVAWVDLYDVETGKVNFNQLTQRIQAAMRTLSIDIRPYENYDDIIPYVNALRTTEASVEKWDEIIFNLEVLSKLKNVDDIADAAEKLRNEGFNPEKMRVEAWGLSIRDLRKKKWWVIALTPLSWIANAPTFIQQFFLNFKGDQMKAIEFRSTLKIGVGMFVYPITWTIMAAVLGGIAKNNGFSFFGWSPFFEIFIGFWAFSTFGNKFYGWLLGHVHDYNDAMEGEWFWNDPKSKALREAWINYIAVIKTRLE